MPLVRVDVFEGRGDDEIRDLLGTIQEVLEEVFAAPPRDRYQVLTEHRPGHLVLEDTGLGIERSDRVVLVQVVQQGRTAEQKKKLYTTLAQRLEKTIGLRGEDLIVSLTENTRADWSFGFGRAQFLDGDL